MYTNNGILKFNREGRLYTYEPSEKYLSSVATAKGMQHKLTATGIDTDLNSDSTNVDNYFLDFLVTKEGNRDG